MSKNEKIYAESLVVPFVLFLVLGFVESKGLGGALSYPAAYSIKILLVGIISALCWKYWVRQFPLRVTGKTALALVLGVLCTVLWVVLAAVPVSIPFFGGARAAFNPFAPENGLSTPMAWSFWAVRMVGLALVIPLIEEVFLRGFLLRWIQGEGWMELQVGEMIPVAWGAMVFYAVATHPEFIAAIVWFTLVTLYVRKTRNLWDAVAFHIGTNAGVGLWVLYSGQWGLM
ncbi:MAG: CAAX prenyl protease-related protein [Thermoguttaceae bacterium]|nr:CAAX prenyl protease-related protein [Thermoguttaceae bacterium]